jgi:hypothetical protein
MTSSGIQTVEGWLPDSSRVWPDEASKRGLPRLRQCKKTGADKAVEKSLDKSFHLWSISSTESIEGGEWKSGFFL